MDTAVAAKNGVLLVDEYDLSNLLSEISQNNERDYTDASTFHLDDREGISGMRGATLTTQFIRKGSYQSYLDIIDRAIGNDDTLHQVTYCPEGAAVGKDAILMRVNQTSVDVNGALNEVVGGSLVFGATGGARKGKVLATYKGTTSLSAAEVQTLVFTNVPADLEMVFRATGDSSESATWKASDSNATLKTRIESLDTVTSTVTVTGTLTTSTDATTGETLYSGTKTLTFADQENIPQLEVLAAEWQRWVVTSGDGDADYAYNGATARALGQTDTQRQTDLRALGGSYAAVVVQGTETAPSAGSDLTTGLSGSATASEYYQSDPSAAPGLAFDDNNGTAWTNYNNLPAWLKIDLGSAQTAVSYSIRTHSNDGRQPATWTLQGSATGAFSGEQTTLDTRTGLVLAMNTVFTYSISSPAAFRYYRIHITAAKSGTYTEIGEMQLLGAASNAAAYHNIYFPYSVGNVSQGTSAGTGGVASTIHAGAADAGALIVEATTTGGESGQAIYTVVTATGNGTSIDGAAQTEDGWTAHLHVLEVRGTSPTLDVVIEHSDDNSSWSTLATFAQKTAAGEQRLESASETTAVKRYVRAKRTVAGTNPKFVYQVGLSRRK